jgi:hypothetical protein
MDRVFALVRLLSFFFLCIGGFFQLDAFRLWRYLHFVAYGDRRSRRPLVSHRRAYARVEAFEKLPRGYDTSFRRSGGHLIRPYL